MRFWFDKNIHIKPNRGTSTTDTTHITTQAERGTISNSPGKTTHTGSSTISKSPIFRYFH